MFISLSKTMAKFGGFRLGVGMRMNKNNTIWLSLIVLFIQLLKAMWYMMIVVFWLMYALGYGAFIALKKLKPYCKRLFTKIKNRTKKEGYQGK